MIRIMSAIRTTTLLIVTAVVAAACDSDEQQRVVPLQLVATAPVTSGYLQKTLTFSGVSRAAKRAELAFQSSGILRVRPVRLGDEIGHGDMLAALKNPELEPQRLAAQSSLVQAQTERAQVQRNVNRFQKLFDDEAIGEQQLEEEQTRLASLDEQIRQAKADLSQTQDRAEDATLIAPFDGVVGQVNFEPGEYVNAGETVLIIGGLNRMEVVVEVPSPIWRRLHEGDTSTVTVLGLNEVYSGTIDDVGTLADPATGLFPVVISYPANPQTQAGQRVIAHLDDVQVAPMLVPMQAIVDPIGGAPRVYVTQSAAANAQTATVRTVAVQVQGYAGDNVAVSSEQLVIDDHVITAGHMSLVDGQQVKLQRAITQTTVAE